LAKKLPLVLAILLVIGALAASLLSYYEGWITNVSDFVSLIISGLVVVMLGAAGALFYDYIKSLRKEETAPIQTEVRFPETTLRLAPKVHTGRLFGEARLDLSYAHVQLHVFWPLHYSIPLLSRWLGYTHAIYTESDLPRVKYIINYKTRNAFRLGAYSWGFLLPFLRIEMNSETKWFPFYSDLWLRKHGFHWTGRAATPADLLEEPHPMLSPLTPKVVETSEPKGDIDQENLPEIIERDYSTATLKLKIWSTTDWIEIGFIDSRDVEIKNHNLRKGTVQSVQEPNSSHLRIDRPDTAFSVTATFEVYSGDSLFVFTRKGDIGILRVHVLNKNDKLLFEIPEYGRTAQKYNYKDFGFQFNDWD